jgi:hypothetical protein
MTHEEKLRQSKAALAMGAAMAIGADKARGSNLEYTAGAIILAIGAASELKPIRTDEEHMMVVGRLALAFDVAFTALGINGEHMAAAVRMILDMAKAGTRLDNAAAEGLGAEILAGRK